MWELDFNLYPNLKEERKADLLSIFDISNIMLMCRQDYFKNVVNVYINKIITF